MLPQVLINKYDKSHFTLINEERRNKYSSIIKQIDKSVKSIKIKREETKNHYGTTFNEEMDFFQVIRDRNVTTSETKTTEYFVKTQETRTQYDSYEYDQEIVSEGTKTILDQSSISEVRSSLADNESSYEESYDYKRFKMEYEEQLEYDIKQGKVLNYTEKEEPKNTLKEALKRIVDLKRPKNCTKEELNQIGIKAIECLLYDYQHTKDITNAKMILSRTWLVLRVWLLIYICLAISCWCQRGNQSFLHLSLKRLYMEMLSYENYTIFQDGVAAVSIVNFVFREKGLYSLNNITQ